MKKMHFGSYGVPLALLTMVWQARSAGPTYCSDLHERYNKYGEMRQVPVEGRGEEAVRVASAGGSARAGAALVAVVLEHRLRYRVHHTAAADLPDLCTFVNQPPWEPVVAAVARWQQCGPDLRWFTWMEPTERSVQLFAHAPGSPQHSDICNVINNKKNIETPQFNVSSFTLLVRNESHGDTQCLKKLNSDLKFKKYINVKTYQDDLHFRLKLNDLRRHNQTFFFVDEEIWADNPNIVPCNFLFDSEKVTSIGDGYFMSMYAPQIANFIENFSLTPSHIQEILYSEEVKTMGDIKESACLWALKHETEFEKWFKNEPEEKNQFNITILLCNDNSSADYLNILRVVKNEIKIIINDMNFELNYHKHNCSNVNDLVDNTKDPKTGYIVWARQMGIEQIKQNDVFMLLAGPTSYIDPLPVAGTIVDFAISLKHLFQQTQWKRFAILSDGTEYAESVTKAIIMNDTYVCHEVVISIENIKKDLQSLKQIDAFVFFVNADWKVAEKVWCTASQLDMTAKDKYAWVMRDWQTTQCNNKSSVYTVGMSWRGESNANLEGSKLVRKKMIELWGIHEQSQDKNKNVKQSTELGGPPDGALLFDTVLQFAHAVAALHRKCARCFRYMNDRQILKSLFINEVNKTNLTGVARDYKPNEIKSHGPFIYVSEWSHLGGRSLAIWRIQNNSVVYVTPHTDFITRLKQVRDSPKCITLTSGDDFSPRCHDIAIFLSITALLLAVGGLIIARRAQLAYRKRHPFDHEYDLRCESILVSYLVDRNSITLLHEIGSGCFGRVFFAELKRPDGDKIPVAVKKPHSNITHAEENELLREACLLAPLSHENVIRLVGVCLLDGPPLVVMEHAYYSDLRRYLVERRQLAGAAEEVSARALSRLARDAAAAVAYVAARRLVHRDVRAANCLVHASRVLKLADFGMARRLGDGEPEYATRRRGFFPILWMAPESLELGVFSPATDVWALGVLLLEVVTLGVRPFGDWPPARVLNYVLEGHHAPLPPDTSKLTKTVVMACWKREPELRPTAEWVRDYLVLHPNALEPALVAATVDRACFHHRYHPTSKRIDHNGTDP